MNRYHILCIIALCLSLYNGCLNNYVTPNEEIYSLLASQTVHLEVETVITPKSCIANNEDEQDLCDDVMSMLPPIRKTHLGTGTLILTKEGVRVLTVSHVCSPSEDVPNEIPFMNFLITPHVNSTITIKSSFINTTGIISKKDADLDVCLVTPKEPTYVYFPEISNSSSRRGSRVKYTGTPFGMMSETYLPMFEGTYAGLFEGRMLFSLPCAPGTSGSSIRNNKNEIISIVQRVHSRFSHLCYGITTENLHKFLEN